MKVDLGINEREATSEGRSVTQFPDRLPGNANPQVRLEGGLRGLSPALFGHRRTTYELDNVPDCEFGCPLDRANKSIWKDPRKMTHGKSLRTSFHSFVANPQSAQDLFTLSPSLGRAGSYKLWHILPIYYVTRNFYIKQLLLSFRIISVPLSCWLTPRVIRSCGVYILISLISDWVPIRDLSEYFVRLDIVYSIERWRLARPRHLWVCGRKNKSCSSSRRLVSRSSTALGYLNNKKNKCYF